jgi:hypothetical protein
MDIGEDCNGRERDDRADPGHRLEAVDIVAQTVRELAQQMVDGRADSESRQPSMGPWAYGRDQGGRGPEVAT